MNRYRLYVGLACHNDPLPVVKGSEVYKTRLETLKRLTDGSFEAYTLFGGESCWKGTSEPSIVIEIFEEGSFKVKVLAQLIKVALLHQEAILYTCEKVESELL